MSIIANIDFVDFFSQKIENTEEINICIKYDDNYYQDKFPESEGLLIQIHNNNEDIKLPLTISKDNNIIGKGSIILNQKQISAKESLITKWINLDQIDSKKGKSLNTIMKINVKISLSYNNLNGTRSNSNLRSVPMSSKGFPINKNHSGNLNHALMGGTMRSSHCSSKQKNDFLTNTRLGFTPKSKDSKSIGGVLNLSDKYRTCADDTKNVLIKIKGKSQGKPKNHTNLHMINNSVSGGVNYNVSHSESNGFLGSASTNCLANERYGTNKSKNSTTNLKKTHSSNENAKKGSISITKITRNSDVNIRSNNLLYSSQAPNLNLKIDDEIDDHVSNDTSIKDSIYNEENSGILETPIFNLRNASQKLSETYNQAFLDSLPEDLSLLKNEVILLIEELFKIQGSYYSSYTESLKNNKKIKELLLEYNTKYRLQNRKNHVLCQMQENLNMKNIISMTINREEKSRFKDISESMKSELSIMKKLFKLEFNQNELSDFKQQNINSIVQIKDEKNVLLKALLNLYKDKDVFSKVPNEKQFYIQTLLKENGLIIFDFPRINNSSLENELKIKNDNNNNNCVEIEFTENTFKDKGSIKNNSEDSNKDIGNSQESKKAETSIECDNEEDDFERKLKVSLNNFNKKVKLRKLSKGVYDYNGHQLRICLDNDDFKVKIGASSAVDLLKFLEMTYKKDGFNNKTNGFSNNKNPLSKSVNGFTTNDNKLKNSIRNTTPVNKK